MTVSKSNERDQDLAALRAFLGMAREQDVPVSGDVFVDAVTKDLAEEYIFAIEDCIEIIEALNDPK